MIYSTTFLHDPEILFIDEPLIGLDPYTIRLIKDLLKEKAENGMTIFLTTHILALAEDIALTIHPHPTLAETEAEAAEIFQGSPTHMMP